jgi:MurNAc alpha-1-phosphate uridylyltransferase
MVLAAGKGLRMRPITHTLPKPLVTVDGRTLLDRALDRLAAAGVETAVVNLHHLGDRIERHLKRRNDLEIRFSHEDDLLLETGGGVKKALPLLGDDPFYVVNGDVLWLDGGEGALMRLAAAWDDDRMDGNLLLHATVDAYGYDGRGDFNVAPDGVLERRRETDVAPYLFAGVQVLHPRLFHGAPDGVYSLNVLYDRALDDGRLYGVVHDGEWFHLGTPEGLAQAEAFMAVRYPGTKRR